MRICAVVGQLAGFLLQSSDELMSLPTVMINSVQIKVRAYAYYILSYVKILTYDSKKKIHV